MSQSRVLSIQSHVVSGYVGNKAAVFPLQLLGFDVDVVNSVQFSNHTGYKHLEGDVLDGSQLHALLKGLEHNDLLDNVGHVLTGYIGSKSFLEAVLRVVETLRKKNNNVRFVCDPVLGDDGRFYVPEELVPMYKTKVLPMANVVTPNQFEVEQLTGIAIRTMDDAQKACRALHTMGPQLVFITSLVLSLGGDKDDSPKPDTMTIVASQQHDNQVQMWKIECPRLPGNYTGTGDLCAALLLGHTTKNPREDDLKSCMERVAGTMHAVVKRTHEMGGDTLQSRELQLIASKQDIENPPSLFSAQRLC